mmetsp:Transcript_22218/g.61657  ORF Transcript_22218/g.61657 Transcript_22218/m.61657 type:complete len:104 (-) Transcript_22218:1293-1604(-)
MHRIVLRGTYPAELSTNQPLQLTVQVADDMGEDCAEAGQSLILLAHYTENASLERTRADKMGSPAVECLAALFRDTPALSIAEGEYVVAVSGEQVRHPRSKLF